MYWMFSSQVMVDISTGADVFEEVDKRMIAFFKANPTGAFELTWTRNVCTKYCTLDGKSGSLWTHIVSGCHVQVMHKQPSQCEEYIRHCHSNDMHWDCYWFIAICRMCEDPHPICSTKIVKTDCVNYAFLQSTLVPIWRWLTLPEIHLRSRSAFGGSIVTLVGHRLLSQVWLTWISIATVPIIFLGLNLIPSIQMWRVTVLSARVWFQSISRCSDWHKITLKVFVDAAAFQYSLPYQLQLKRDVV